MIEYQEALQVLRSFSSEPETEIIDLENAVGRTLSTHLMANETSPPFDNSAMDGYLVRSSATASATSSNPVLLPVKKCLGAGDTSNEYFDCNSALEIMTGAPIPASDHDCVIKIEDVAEIIRNSSDGTTHILLTKPFFSGANIRRAGEDFQSGQVLFQTGQTIELSHLLVLATLGISQLSVVRMPKVGLISTGKELVSHSVAKLGPGQIRNSTGLYLKKSLEALHHPVIDCGNVADDPDLFLNHVKNCLNSGAQLVLSTGAVSMGRYDFVKSSLERMGAQIHFHKCAIRPGKPILFASTMWEDRRVFFFGMPGNPISTAVGFRFFVRPFLDHIVGRSGSNATKTDSQYTKAKLANDFKKPEGYRCFFKAHGRTLDSGEQVVEPLTGQASFMVSPLLKANSWVVFNESDNVAKAGSIVEVCKL